MSKAMIKLAKEVINLNGDVNAVECLGVSCDKCMFSLTNNNLISCGEDTKENYVKIAKKYLIDMETDTDAVLESALSIDVPSIEMVEKENEDVKVERKMSLKEKILAKIDYKRIAEEVFDILEDEIVQEVVSSFDEMEIAYDLIDGYRSDFIETAREVIVENIGQEINVDDVSDHLKEIAVDKIDEL